MSPSEKTDWERILTGQIISSCLMFESLGFMAHSFENIRSFFFFFFETVKWSSLCSQAALEFRIILLSLPPECWECGCTSLCLDRICGHDAGGF